MNRPKAGSTSFTIAAVIHSGIFISSSWRWRYLRLIPFKQLDWRDDAEDLLY